MSTKTQIYIAMIVAAVFATGTLGGHLWSNHQIAKLERETEAAKEVAEGSRQAAEKKEIEAAAYKQKIEYLERHLTDIQTTARKQDEKLEKQITNSRNARVDVERSKRTRTIDANTAELCAKLAELGHPCSE
ncbi:hypothetical protein BH10ACI3_BH10ACI3_23140 [soil metagenome]